MTTLSDVKTAQDAGGSGHSGASAKLACNGVWKIFGVSSEEFRQSFGSAPSSEQLAEHGLLTAVRDVNLEVREGEIFVIMGLSGSGKSTLVRCMSRLIEPTAGATLFDGQDLAEMSDKALMDVRRHKMGMVFQNFALLPHLSVLENVAFPLKIQGVERASREAQARKVIELVGLAGREEYYPRELSGGQKQRVGVGRSLVVEPDVWFLDEPFSALDPLIRRQMQNEFLRLQGLLKKTIVFITHDFEEAVRLADRIAIMKEGVVEQIGTPEQLLTAPATDYVADFTYGVPREKVLSVGSIMRPDASADTPEGGDEAITVDLKLKDVAERILKSERPVPVVDREGRRVGCVDRDAVIDALFRPPNDATE